MCEEETGVCRYREEETITEEKKEIIMKKTTLIAAVVTLFVVLTTTATAYYEEGYGYGDSGSSLQIDGLDIFADGVLIDIKSDPYDLDQVESTALISAVNPSPRLEWGLGFLTGDNLMFDSSAVTFNSQGRGGFDVNESTKVAMSGTGEWMNPIPATEVFSGLGFLEDGYGIVTVYGADGSEGYFEVVPEPSMIALMGIGGLILSRRNRKA